MPGRPRVGADRGVQDIDIDPAGNLYLFNDWSQIVRVDNGVVNNWCTTTVWRILRPASTSPCERRPPLFRELPRPAVYWMFGSSMSDFVIANPPTIWMSRSIGCTIPYAPFEHHLRTDERLVDLRGHRQ